MTVDLPSLIADGRAALATGDWEQAAAFFEESLTDDETAEAQAGLGEALWWMGDLSGSMHHRERAYALFRRGEEPAEAVLCALLLVFDYQGHVGNYAASAGWLARAKRLVDDFDLDEFRGWLHLAKSCQGGDPADGEQLARKALEFASATQDLDLELCALSQIGAHLVQQGRIADGIGYLDEAMAGSLGGEGGNRDTVVFAGCNMMVSCISAADLDRAVHWVHAADRFAQRYGCPFLYAECRSIYGRVLFATGDWSGAEQELKTAIASAKNSVPVYHAQALATLAELRLAQGRLAEARRLVSGIEDHPWAVPVVARIHLLADRRAAAEAVLRRRLHAIGADTVESGVLLELQGESAIAGGHVDSAIENSRRLLKLGEDLDCRILTVRGERLLGRARVVNNEIAVARQHLESAAAGFAQLQMVYEAVLTRLLIGELLLDTEPELAEAEILDSLEVFRSLGAHRDADFATQLLRRLGSDSGVRPGPRSKGPLTNREEQVLGLLGEGLSNPEIAERLYISRKTVEHHVARVLSKIGVRNRAEAAAEAVRRLGAESTGM